MNTSIERPEPDHGGVYRWRGNVAAALEKAIKEDGDRNAVKHDRDQPVTGGTPRLGAADLPGCGKPATARYEIWLPSVDGYGLGRLIYTIRWCAGCACAGIDDVDAAGLTAKLSAPSSFARCGSGWDFTVSPCRFFTVGGAR